jgi:Fe2+ or Zn2+ uptake regulation protein
MPLIFATEQDAARALREAGLKATPQRLAILRSLAADETHPTAQELYDRLSSEFPSLSVATVYNTLSALTRIGRCIPLELGGPLRFDPNVDAHDHAVCERCGAIRDVSAPLVEAQPIQTQIEALPMQAQPQAASDPEGLPGFTVRRVERIYRGLCAACAAQDSEAVAQ